MKRFIIIAIALLIASHMFVPAEPTATQTQTQIKPLDRTQEYRMASAERMIERLVIRLGKMNTVCNYATASETCKQSVIGLYPQLQTIREVAARGDNLEWAKIVNTVQALEKETDPAISALNAVGRK